MYSDYTDGDLHRGIQLRQHRGYTTSSHDNSHTSLVGNTPRRAAAAAYAQSREYGGVSTSHSHGREFGAGSAARNRNGIPASVLYNDSKEHDIISVSLNQGREYGAVSAARNQHAAPISFSLSQGREYSDVSSSQSLHRALVSTPARNKEYGTKSATHSEGRDYTAVSASGQEHTICFSQRSKKESSAVVKVGDRRNEFFTLKRYIFMTLGMPGTPAVTPRMQTVSSKLSRSCCKLSITNGALTCRGLVCSRTDSSGY